MFRKAGPFCQDHMLTKQTHLSLFGPAPPTKFATYLIKLISATASVIGLIIEKDNRKNSRKKTSDQI